MKNHYISAAGVSFSKQFGLFIKLWTGEHNVLPMAQNNRLKKSCSIEIYIGITKTRPFNIIALLWLQKRKVSDEKCDLFVIFARNKDLSTR